MPDALNISPEGNQLVCGRIKEGKTTFAIFLARQFSDGILIWDPRHMIAGGSYVSDAEELEDAIQEEEWRKGPIVFRPDALHLTEDFDAMCEVLFTPPDRFDNFALIVDEAADLQSAQRIQPHLARALKQHPRTVLVIQTAHSLQDWNRPSKDLMNDLYCFKLIGRSALAVVDYCDGSEELETTIKTLPRHHLVHVSFEGGTDEEEFEVLDKPEEWYSPVTEREDANVGAEVKRV